jgi:hypothetical protein
VSDNELTEDEKQLYERLPGPPTVAKIRVTNVWIIEWLPPDDKHTGRTLQDWMNARRSGWSSYTNCSSKAQVIQSIQEAALHARTSEMHPVLHLEAHGDEFGLQGPDGAGGSERLPWDELTDPLQQLNLATLCQLVVMVAACTGFAGIQALTRGPRAPAIALVGPDARIMESALLNGTEEFYRRLMDEAPHLHEMAASASRETGSAVLAVEPFATLAYEAIVKRLIMSMRPCERLKRIERLSRRMLAETSLSESDIDRRLADLPEAPSPTDLQRMWDRMFMIDLHPPNQECFGVDMATIVATIVERTTGALDAASGVRVPRHP